MCCVTKNTPQLSDLNIFSSHSFAGSLRVTGPSPDPGCTWCRSRPQVWPPGGADHTELLGVSMHQGPSSSHTSAWLRHILAKTMAEAQGTKGSTQGLRNLGLGLKHLHFCLILLANTNPWLTPESQGRDTHSACSEAPAKSHGKGWGYRAEGRLGP